MQTNRHPMYVAAEITCHCGTTMHTRSTVPEQRLAVCSHCHPYFTGRQKRIDAAGRIEAFQRKYGDVRQSTR